MTKNPLTLFFEMSKYQQRLYFLLFISAIFNAFPALVPLVASYTPKFQCDLSHSISGYGSGIKEENQTKNFFLVEETNSVGQKKLSNCYYYNRTWEDYLEYLKLKKNITTFSQDKVLCKKHTFNFEDGESSAAIDFEMYCEKKHRKSYVVTLYMAGMLTGTVISGYLSDSFGRKVVFLTFQLSQFIMFFFAGLVKSYETYCLVVFLYGTTGLVNYMSAIVLGTELTRQHFRNLISMSVQIAFGISYMLFPLFAYFIRDWRWFYYVGGLCGLIYIPYIWIIDESPRWLISAGRKAEAERIIEKIAKYNGGHLETRYEDFYSGDQHEVGEREMSWMEQIVTLLTNRVLLGRLLIMGSAWCMLTISYYGIALTTNELSGNRFVTCFISGASETATYFVSFLIVEYFGRRNAYISFTVLASILIAASPFLSLWNPYLTTVSTILAKVFVSVSFYIVYVMTPELFPTKLRHTSTAFDSGFARVGGIIMSFILYEDKFITGPVIGALIFFLTLLVFTIPKTHNVPLPETIEEAVALDNGVIRCCGQTKRVCHETPEELVDLKQG